MGTGKKEASRKERQGRSDGMNNVKTKGENFYRSLKLSHICGASFVNQRQVCEKGEDVEDVQRRGSTKECPGQNYRSYLFFPIQAFCAITPFNFETSSVLRRLPYPRSLVLPFPIPCLPE